MYEWEHKRDTNGMPYKERVIGFVDVPAGVQRTNRYEYAAWYETLELKPGRYEVREVESHYTGLNSVVAILPGTIVDKYTASLFGGVPFADNPQDKTDLGKESTYHARTYAYTVKDESTEVFGFPFTKAA